MRLSETFGRTLREAPAEAELVSLALAARAGMVRLMEGGGLAYLPLGWRALERLTGLVRETLTELGAQEMLLPAGSAEEQAGAVADLARREIDSYRRLPRLLFHFSTRPGAAFGRALREVTVCTAYSLHLEQASLDETYRRTFHALLDVFQRLALPVATVEAGPVAEGEPVRSLAVVLPHPQGREVILHCAGCGYAATEAAAVFRLGAGVEGEAAPLEKVATPDCHTIADLARYLGLGERQTLKAVFYVRDEREFVFAVIRGDLDVNESKLLRALGGGALRPATDAEIRAVGAAPGYASPAGLRVRSLAERSGAQAMQAEEPVTVVADPSIEMGANFAAGANEAGYHFVNVNYPRDFEITLMADIAQAGEGQACARCGGPLQAERTMTLAMAEQAGGRYSMDAQGRPRVTALDAGGRPQPVLMGVYSLGIDPLLAAVLETHHDEAGLRWPEAAAPFAVHLVSLLKSGDEAERLYADLRAAGVSVLFDERAESPGVKFADADLIGCPLRLTVSSRSLKAGGVEVKRRNEDERAVMPFGDVITLALGAAGPPSTLPPASPPSPSPD